jgi:putative DNA primase/helicase
LSAADLANALGGYRIGVGWMARCPAHEDRTPSLSICDADDGKTLVRCHAGCEQAQVIDALRNRALWATNDRHRHHSQQFPRSPHHRNGPTDAERSAAALAIWHASAAAPGTLAENYLRSRGLYLPLPTTLRFHAGLRHPSGGVWSGMVALVTHGTDETPVAIHRTLLAVDGNGKAPLDPAKIMLGPCRGGAVRLGRVQPDQWLIIAEGIETTLTVMEACGLPGWAALSASGIKNLILPPEAAKLLICADNDHNGTGQRAAREAAERFLREGRRVRIATPPNSNTDFNDLLRLAELGHLHEGAHDVA